MRKMNGYRKRKILAAAMACMMALNPLHALAAEASVTFGSNWYNGEEGVAFPVGVYISGDTEIGEYHVTMKYDRQCLEYVSGADGVDEENGILTLTGSPRDEGIKYWLQFRPIVEGEGSLAITSADVRTKEGEECTLTVLGTAPVYIGISSQEEDGQEEENQLPEENEGEGQQGQDLAGPGDGEADAQEPFNAGVEDGREDGEAIPENEAPMQEGEVEARSQEPLVPGDVEAGWGDENLAPKEEAGQQEKNPLQEGEENTQAGNVQKKPVYYNTYLILALAALALVVVVELLLFGLRKVLAKDNTEEKALDGDKALPVSPSGENEDGELLIYDLENEPDSLLQEEKLERELGSPVIRVNDVTMEFHLSSSNPSGLKDYFIQMAKRQITYRKLYALYHVSFNVYRGEVVGIIGTNGSGKSTLLKIVSGAIKPTEGKVEVNRRKVQLLTLGTGFDGELTARENVYLNGSIIGYSKKFLDEHYEDIVKFAELQDFMEEKVKNFSSGMVSRLGFAIATAGAAAEILILDEVLSVGDEFFRKKSLKRIKEMIHGGSTVLLVSHGMGTILEHCTRCVWIEKGRLRMTGDPKEVCRAYQGMQPEG